jgi:hypothetical protein
MKVLWKEEQEGRRFLLKLLLDNRLDNPVTYAVQVSVSTKEINLKRKSLWLTD